VILSIHKHETGAAGWHLYPPEQIDAALKLGSLLLTHYSLRDVVGHEDIAPERKFDSGPAFPMPNFRAHLLGRQEEQEVLYETKSELKVRGDLELNIRQSRGVHFRPLRGSRS
jgi:N-acetylmuramoyl-L-alanine amidase